MQHFLKEIYEYCSRMTEEEPSYLHKIYRSTHLKTAYPQMLTGHLTGRFYALLSKLLSPGRILEIGTFTGYSALCWAEGLIEDGRIDTIEVNPELERLIREHWSWAPKHIRDKLRLHIGDATELLVNFEGEYDLIFVDGNKRQYMEYYHVCLPLLKPGGLMIWDNTLWSGKVLCPGDDGDAQVLNQFNSLIKADHKVEVIILPLRDGLSFVRKKTEK